MEKLELKEKIQKLMEAHLEAVVGWPDCEPEAIMHELKPMWILIEEAGLIQPGMSYEVFCAHAQKQFLINEINSIRRLR